MNGMVRFDHWRHKNQLMDSAPGVGRRILRGSALAWPIQLGQINRGDASVLHFDRHRLHASRGDFEDGALIALGTFIVCCAVEVPIG